MPEIDLVVVDKAGNRSAPKRVSWQVGTTPPITGFPNASNTGVPPGTTLTPYTGPKTIVVHGTVIENKIINGGLLISANNVTIRKCKIVTGAGTNVGIQVNYPVATTGCVIEDCEMYGGGKGGTIYGVAWGNYTMRRVNIYGFCHPGQVGGDNCTIEDCYMHDPADNAAGDAHIDTIQIVSGRNTVIRHNTLENPFGQTAALLASADLGATVNLLVEKNFMAGGGYTMYLTEKPNQKVSGTIIVKDNRFSKKFFPKGGYYGPTNVQIAAPYTWTNNVWDDTGLPVR
jgi:hypothetical protein